MLLKSSPSFSLQTISRKSGLHNSIILHGPSFSIQHCFNGLVKLSQTNNATALPSFAIKAAAAANEGDSNSAILSVAFEPFAELKEELLLVPSAPQESIARYKFTDSCEAAINVQINVEYNVSYVYHALHAYFDRDNVALKGLARFFKESSLEERQHAEKLMEYQNKRGGRVKLQMLKRPLCDNFDDIEKGDALFAIELALSLEKLTNEKLLNLLKIAEENNDAQLADFVQSEFLSEQVDAINKISEYVAQLRRVGKGHGVWEFDQMLFADVRVA